MFKRNLICPLNHPYCFELLEIELKPDFNIISTIHVLSNETYQSVVAIHFHAEGTR